MLFVEGALKHIPCFSFHFTILQYVPDEKKTVISCIGFNPCLQLQQDLNAIDLLEPSADFGGDIFMQTEQCVGLQSYRNHCTFKNKNFLSQKSFNN